MYVVLPKRLNLHPGEREREKERKREREVTRVPRARLSDTSEQSV